MTVVTATVAAVETSMSSMEASMPAMETSMPMMAMAEPQIYAGPIAISIAIVIASVVAAMTTPVSVSPVAVPMTAIVHLLHVTASGLYCGDRFGNGNCRGRFGGNPYHQCSGCSKAK